MGGISQNRIPDFCIECCKSDALTDAVIHSCDKAFEEHSIINRKDYQRLLEKVNSYAFFYYAYNQSILGYAAMYANDTEQHTAYITLIAVDVNAQKKGIGKRLLEECFATARNRKMNTIFLEVRKNNRNAIRFYQANGFVWAYDKDEENYIFKKMLEE